MSKTMHLRTDLTADDHTGELSVKFSLENPDTRTTHEIGSVSFHQDRAAGEHVLRYKLTPTKHDGEMQKRAEVLTGAAVVISEAITLLADITADAADHEQDQRDEQRAGEVAPPANSPAAQADDRREMH